MNFPGLFVRGLRRLPKDIWRSRFRTLDGLFHIGTAAGGGVLVALFLTEIFFLTQKSWPTITGYGFGFILGTVWNPNPPAPVFGAWPYIVGTLLTSAIAMLLAVPLSLGIAVFLSEEAPSWLRVPLSSLVELLVAVPSVVYGLWGIFVLEPIMRTTIEPDLHMSLGRIPGLGGVFPTPSAGGDVLTASVVLAIMVVPTIAAISRESMRAVPDSQREAVLSLGATRWETTRLGVIPYARSGIIGACILGLGRALGETMAVTMTIGNSNHVPSSLFMPGQTLASAIANEFNNSFSPLERSALIEAGLVLLGITLLVNLVARMLVRGLVGSGSGAAGE
ncbi:MAG: phosphate ABC transporter permease subunit PstC [Thermoplasmata archaeon]|nr:phosphate ABC transporter permease subunit PstC [Thermoplasmata archaeon]MCI4338197.1 phosphate ABC transporter permease subunit PstC [Thermoplasmata archaeon]MCI4342010.1 phosphate ABC transporter permease subunit PstC [Thermoplasmata archaeon]